MACHRTCNSHFSVVHTTLVCLLTDCYVAVAGLPEKRDDHAVVMARFSRDIRQKMNDLTKQLELSLGPDTGDLSLRIGLHSGPVTAGVLRGEKTRFQLFGDVSFATISVVLLAHVFLPR